MKYEIAIKAAGDLQPFYDFLEQTNSDLQNAKGLVVRTDDDIKYATDYIKDLKGQEKAVIGGKNIAISLAGIKVFDDELVKRREVRLNLNTQVEDFRKAIKKEALDYFLKNAQELIDKSSASQSYKNSINIHKIANDTIFGKSKGLKESLIVELSAIDNRLVANAKETTAKMDVIKNYDDGFTLDLEHLLSLPIEALKPELDIRKIKLEQKIKDEAEIKAKEILLQKQQQEQQAASEAVELGNKHEIQQDIRPKTETKNSELTKDYILTIGFHGKRSELSEISSYLKEHFDIFQTDFREK